MRAPQRLLTVSSPRFSSRQHRSPTPKEAVAVAVVAAAVLVEAEQQAVALRVRAAQAARRPAQAQVRREPREAPHPASLARRTQWVRECPVAAPRPAQIPAQRRAEVRRQVRSGPGYGRRASSTIRALGVGQVLNPVPPAAKSML
jgi:hypothetical protein